MGPHDVVSAPVVALARRQVVEVTGGSALDRLFDGDGQPRRRRRGPAAPRPDHAGDRQELAAAGARAVLVDGPIPAGRSGSTSRPRSPRWACRRSAAAARRALADGVPVELGVGAAAFGENAALGAIAPFASTGSRSTGARGRDRRPGRRPRHVGSRPQRGRCGALRHVERLQRRRRRGRRGRRAPRPGAAGPRRVRSARSARRGRAAAGCRRRPRARRPRGRLGRRARGGAPVAALGAITEARPEARGRLVLRNVSRRPLVVALSSRRRRGGGHGRTRPERVVLRPGGSREIEVSVAARVLPAAPGALEGVVRAVVGPGHGCASPGLRRSRSPAAPSSPASRCPGRRSARATRDPPSSRSSPGESTARPSGPRSFR